MQRRIVLKITAAKKKLANSKVATLYAYEMEQSTYNKQVEIRGKIEQKIVDCNT